MVSIKTSRKARTKPVSGSGPARIATTPESESWCPIVALGASAGGLEAFERFFDRLSPNPGIAFVLIQHSDAAHRTLIPELLRKHTSMPVLAGEDGMSIQPDHIYVIPSQLRAQVVQCVLRVEPTASTIHEPMPIDRFFRSLAEDQGSGVVGIILSGMGTDGTLGLMAIKEHGGLTLAETPESARYDSMPRNAALSGFVDFVMPIGELAGKVTEYVTHLQAALRKRDVEELHAQAPDILKRVLPILRKRTSHDFSHYRESTLIRRLHRRMQLHYLDSIGKYVDLLRKDPDETDKLFRDLLIGVTQFFRDPRAFELIEQLVVPDLFKGRTADNSVRVWVAGCATGEEAYSVAMLLLEHRETLKEQPKLQVFATDIDNEALAFARLGRYPSNIAEQMSPERVGKFFNKTQNGYEVREELREVCVFSPHNLIKDPPFSRLDLISCRNLLIYLEAELQRKLLPVFHYGLNPSGYLFLGPSESVAARSGLFHSVDSRHRIFQRKPTSLHVSAYIQLPDGSRVPKLHPHSASSPATSRENNQARAIERVILEDFAPASVIVDAQGSVVYISGPTGRFLEPQAGAPSNKLISMARKNVRAELRTALYRAMTAREEVVRERIPVKSGRETRVVNLIVRPLAELGKDSDLYIVVFEEVHSPRGRVSRKIAPDSTLPLVQELEQELRTTREDLQTTIEEFETSNEDLKSANEELISMNEELQSTNEELQTSKEEVQSSNDELQKKNEELDAAHADLQNFFQGSNLASVFLDRNLRVKRFTPALTAMFRLVQRDIGRPLLEAIPELALHGSLDAEIQRVIGTGMPYEKQLQLGTKGREWLLLRVNPYRAADHSVHGAVVTFTDITGVKVAEREHSQLAAVVESSQDAISSTDLQGIVTTWNEAAERLFGFAASEIVGKPIYAIIPPDRYDEEASLLDQVRRGERLSEYETIRRRKDGSLVDVSLSISPVKDAEGTVIGTSKITRDITERRRADEVNRRLAAIIEFSDDAILSKDTNGVIKSWNQGAQRMFGYTADEVVGKSVTILIPPDHLDEEPEILARIRRGESIAHYETVRRRKDGKLLEISLTVSPILNANNHVIGASKIARDITEKKRVERSLAQAREKLARANQELEKQVQERTTELMEANSQLEAFVYSIAHDLRAPLRAMQAFSTILLEDYAPKLDDTATHYTKRIARAAESMDRLVLDLLAFGRMARSDIELGAVNVANAWSGAVAQMEQIIREKKAQVEALPPFHHVRGHEATLSQVLANLLGNALKFVPPGAHPNVRFRTEQADGVVRLWVEDNGIGIAPEHQDRIFRIFERLRPAEYEGTGIGLAIVKKGVERMGGRIGLESAPGRGTRFWIELNPV
jgi:two-component system CheB/CheR fusion protein